MNAETVHLHKKNIFFLFGSRLPCLSIEIEPSLVILSLSFILFRGKCRRDLCRVRSWSPLWCWRYQGCTCFTSTTNIKENGEKTPKGDSPRGSCSILTTKSWVAYLCFEGYDILFTFVTHRLFFSVYISVIYHQTF